jgi:hypothetical protein
MEVIEIFCESKLICGWMSGSLQARNLIFSVDVRRAKEINLSFRSINFTPNYRELDMEADQAGK